MAKNFLNPKPFASKHFYVCTTNLIPKIFLRKLAIA